jgi:hypothetical protein
MSKTNVSDGLKIIFWDDDGLITTNRSLHVLVRNVSGKPQWLYEEWNSWGYSSISLQWTDEQGHSGIVAKLDADFTKNFPSTKLLEPGGEIVRSISFDPKIWSGWPPITCQTRLTVKVIYDTIGCENPRARKAWIGSVTSDERTFEIWPADASPTH